MRDQTNAVIPGAQITVVNSATNITLRTVTNEVGFYVFAGVVPGLYRISVESPGMQRFEGTLTTQVQQDAVVDVVLKVGQTVTEVAIQDVTPMLTVDNPTLGHVLERQRIEQLPINGRFITSLLQTVPGLELVNTIATTTSVRPYGVRHGSAEFILDGASINQRMHGGTVQRPPGLDTVQEFKVETNNSSARFARPTTIIISTKSGTNTLHGALFETHRNNAIGKSRTRTDFYSKPPQLIRNEYGASAGGPVYLPSLYNGKDRTFWFFAYEGYRNISPVTRSWNVPTQAMRNGDFRGLVDSQGRQYKIYDPWTTDPNAWQRQQFSYAGQLNVIDPARLSPLAKYLYSVTPTPTFPEVNPLVSPNWFGPGPDTARHWTVTTRIDHRFSDNDQFYARYTRGDLYYYRIGQPAVTAFAALDGVSNQLRDIERPQSLALSWVRTFSPTFFNELLVSGSRVAWRTQCGDDVKYADQVGLPNPLDAIGWPTLSDTGLSGYSFGSTNRRAGYLNYYIIDNNSTRVVGVHEFDFGVHYRYDQMNTLPAQQQVQGSHSWGTGATALYDSKSSRTNPLATALTGHNLANMYLGVMDYSNQFVRGYFYMRTKELVLYFQDKYKVTPRLTLNLGLRWEYWPAIREKNNVLTSFDPERRAIILGLDLDTMWNATFSIPELNQFLPGAVPADFDKRNRLYNYRRDPGVPKHRVSWNWIVDLPFGKGKRLAASAGRVLDRIIGGWQVAGTGSLRSNYFELPGGIYPNGNKIELYGYKYPIQDCQSGVCVPGYLWWNGYIPANRINSVNASGKPNGVMGVPPNYKPAGQPIWPWPANPNTSDPMYSFYGTNTVWVPLKDGSVQRTTYNDNLHPWRQQFFPGVRQWGLDGSLFKSMPVTERVALRFNADFFNVLNHPGNPNTIGADGILRTQESGQSARELQLTLRLSW